MNKKTPMSECIKNGIIVYPVYIRRKWFLRVEVKGQKTITYTKKEISKNAVLSGKELEDPVNKTYQYWYEKLIK